jgi:hypothetical protein
LLTFLTLTVCLATAERTPPLVTSRKENESDCAPGTGLCPEGAEGRGLSSREAVELGVEKKSAALLYTSLQAPPVPAAAAAAEE